MSVKVMGMVFDAFPEGGSKLLIMLALADFARDDGSHIWPSVPSLSAKVRLGDRQVRYILRELVEQGYLEVEKQGKGGNQMGTTHYSICLKSLVGQPVTPAPECSPDAQDRAAEGELDCTHETPALDCTPALQRVDPCTVVPQPLHPTAPNPSLTVINHHHQPRAGAREEPLPVGVGDGGGGSAAPGAGIPEPGQGEAVAPVAGRIGPTPTTLHPPMGAEALAHARMALDHAEAHRRESSVKELIIAGVDDPGTRERLASMPLVTASLIRHVKRQSPPGLGGGGIVNRIEAAAERALFAQGGGVLVGGDGDAEQSNATPAASPRVERTEAMLAAGRADASNARCEWAETLGVLQRHEPAEIEAAKEAVLEAQPTLRRTLGGEDPLRNRMLGTLVAERLDHEPSAPGSPKGIAAQQEAVTA